MLLSYFEAGFGLLLGRSVYYALGGLVGALALVALAVAGYGIANDRRWAYRLGVAITFLALVPFIVFLGREGLDEIFDLNLILFALFPVARFLLFVHPQSREYQRLWFK